MNSWIERGAWGLLITALVAIIIDLKYKNFDLKLDNGYLTRALYAEAKLAQELRSEQHD